MKHQLFIAGLIRLHVLHHAAEGEIYGQAMMDELGRHGYRIGPGTLYPMLHALEVGGYLTSREVRDGRSSRRLYRATRRGRVALESSKDKIRELFHETLGER